MPAWRVSTKESVRCTCTADRCQPVRMFVLEEIAGFNMFANRTSHARTSQHSFVFLSQNQISSTTKQETKPKTSTMKITSAAVRNVARDFGSKLGPLDPHHDHAFDENQPSSALYRRYNAHFGMGPSKLARFWNEIDAMITDLSPSEIKWYLTTMYFLRCYPTCEQLGARVGHDEKTVRKYIWKFVDYVSQLELVCQWYEDGRIYFSHADTNERQSHLQTQMRNIRSNLQRLDVMIDRRLGGIPGAALVVFVPDDEDEN